MKYIPLTYAELLVKYGIKSDPLSNPTTDYLRKVKDYTHHALFIVPEEAPMYDPQPIYRPSGEKKAIDLGSYNLLATFAMYFFHTSNWQVTEDGSICSYLDELSAPAPLDEKIIKKIFQWTNQFGALLTEPISETRIETLYGWKYVPFSDSIYYSFRTEMGNIPYFLSVDAFYELAHYALKLLFVIWLYGNEKNLREKIKPDNAHSAEEAIEKAYWLLSPDPNNESEVLAQMKLGEQQAAERKTPRLRQYAWISLCNHLSAWIQIEIVPSLLRLDSAAETRCADKIIPYGQDLADWTANFRYQCSSLLCCMMLEALGSLNRKSKYRVCQYQDCRTIFTIDESNRIDKKYCSLQCKNKARNKRN